MVYVIYAALTFVILNFCIFVVSAKLFFDSSKGEALSRLFYFFYATLLALSLYGDFQYPTKDIGRGLGAIVCCAVSLALFVTTIQVTRKRPLTVIFSPDVPKHLFDAGPYRYVRHPYYTSYLTTYFACSLLSTHLLPLICCSVAVAVYFIGASGEEKKFLDSDLATRYRQYQARTGMFFPRLTRIFKRRSRRE